jgi:hypothetical protein
VKTPEEEKAQAGQPEPEMLAPEDEKDIENLLVELE